MISLTSILLILGALCIAHFFIVLLLLLPIFLLIHFLPSILARQKEHFVAILLLNIFLGWTIIGWIAALIWSLTDTPKTVIYNSFEPVRFSGNNNNTHISDELNKLKSMRDSGLLTDEEFTKAKNKLLS